MNRKTANKIRPEANFIIILRLSEGRLANPYINPTCGCRSAVSGLNSAINGPVE